MVGNVDDAAGDGGVPRLHPGHAGGGEAAQAEALADAEHDHRQGDAQHVAVSTVTRLAHAVPASMNAQPAMAAASLLIAS